MSGVNRIYAEKPFAGSTSTSPRFIYEFAPEVLTTVLNASAMLPYSSWSEKSSAPLAREVQSVVWYAVVWLANC